MSVVSASSCEGDATSCSSKSGEVFESKPLVKPCTYRRITELPSLTHLGYTLGKTLGSGTYAKVKAAWSTRHQTMIAIKILNKSAASHDYLTKFLPREIEILQKISHPSILAMYEIIETDKQVFFMMELAQNGDLLDYINTRRVLKESEAKYLFRQMVSAIQHLHYNKLVHRDLKCENVMLSSKMTVVLGDFGFSLNLATSKARTPCGSYSYAAPELFTSSGGSYDAKKSDAWSLGVILYAMVCGRLPFGDDSQVKAQQKNGLLFSSGRIISEEVKDLLRHILNPIVPNRYDTLDMLLHTWTASKPIEVPRSVSSKPKYTLENCLPLVAQKMMSLAPSSGEGTSSATPAITPVPFTSMPVSVPVDQVAMQTTPTHRPLVARIGRKIADVVRSNTASSDSAAINATIYTTQQHGSNSS